MSSKFQLIQRESVVVSAAQPQARLTATELGADRDFSVLYRVRGNSERIGSDECVSADLRH